MPKLHHKKVLTANLSLGVQVGFGTQDVENKGVWTARIKFPGQRAKYKTTKVPYAGGNETLFKEAQRVAYEILEPEANKYARGFDINDGNYVSVLIGQYQDEIEEHTEFNETGKEVYEVIGGRGYWNTRKLNKTKLHLKYLWDFCHSLDRNHKHHIHKSPLIESITKKEWDTLDRWLQINEPQLGVETRLHVNTCARQFLAWCVDKEYIQAVPQIRRPSRGGIKGARERMRREITPEDYLRIVKHTRDAYQKQDENLFENFRHYQYLFHCWVMILANTGIRPPTGATEHTLIKWEHVKDTGVNEDRPVLSRPDEKGHTYEAVIMPGAYHYFSALRSFYEAVGMECKPQDYVFRHTWDNITEHKKVLWKRGDPIYAFRKQWVKMVEALGLAKKGAPQSERVSPSSLRAWFITQRLYADTAEQKPIDVLQLARATGTSVNQIEIRYARLDATRSYEYLTAGGYTTSKEPKYEFIDGVPYYVGREDFDKDGDYTISEGGRIEKEELTRTGTPRRKRKSS